MAEDIFGGVAPMVERSSPKRNVVGSSPTAPANVAVATIWRRIAL